MSNDFGEYAQELNRAAAEHCDTAGAELCAEVDRVSMPLLFWINYLRTGHLTGTADELISGMHSSIIEVAACLCLGLVRPAIFSIRAQVDMAVSWMYFKDHAVEWQHLQEEGQGFIMKKTGWLYLEDYYPNFKRRFEILDRNKRRQERDPYGLLSAHIHSQSGGAIPRLSDLKGVVKPVERSRECVLLQHEVSEYLNDVFLACYAGHWASLPDPVLADAKSRLHDGELRDLCS